MSTPIVLSQARIDESGTIFASPSFNPVLHDELTQLRDTLALPPGDETEFPFVRFANRATVLIGTVKGRQVWARALGRVFYERVPNPFFLIEIAPPDWEGKNPQDISLEKANPPGRDTKTLQKVLAEGDGPFLLGGCQTLVDQGKILLQRDQPEEKTIRDLWQLLPLSIQGRTSFTAFAPDNHLGFDLAVLRETLESHPGFLSEDQARDYPESRYERELQAAIESGDERSLQALLNRRSSGETLKLAFSLVIGMAILSIAARILTR
ncbi:hypothetical protein [Zavarzinella formosa]|uniref:hypothetical protein n=1 Tax=Zavarzinella formosa TaxID=360055 RepID=UPI0003765480|nr:hypothetical protein [Zavarzinella formosa]